jgi:hypothetical protein
VNVIAADYHRNGVCGNGFYVGIVESPTSSTTGRRMLVISFTDSDSASTAVFDLDELSDGNVYMHSHINEDLQVVEGTGGNAWRGADSFQDAVKAIEDQVERNREATHRFFLEG